MLLTLLTAAIKALSDSFIQAIFGLIQQEMHDRGLIQQGREQQHSDDLTATVQEAKDAAQIREQVQAMPDSALNDDLNRLRNASSPSGGL